MKTIAKLTTVLFLALVVVLLTLTSIALAGPANSTARPESKVLWPQARPLAAAPITYTLDVTATNVLTGVYESSVAWGDYDNDGDLDILLTGAGSGGPLAKLYENTGSGFAENITASNVLTGVEYSSVAWGDYDNDGDLDILLTGDTGGYNPLTSVYENTGAGFSVDAVASNDLAQVRYSSVAWGDYDNDGDLDILLTGMSSGGALAEVYENTGTSFSKDQAASSALTGVYASSVAWGDYDNDGDLDILLTGRASSSFPLAAVYKNTGSSFELATDLHPSAQVMAGSVAWGDYDNDGDLDILLTGFEYGGARRTGVFENTDASFSIDVDASNDLAQVHSSSVAWGDYDNDGDLDILLTGNSSGGNQASVYENTGARFSEDATASSVLTRVQKSSVAWGDYDNDGDLDILLTGDAGSSNYVASVFRNDAAPANTPPTAPSGLSSNVDGQQVTVSWNAASDSQTITATTLTYNLRVGTSSGLSDTLAPMSCVGPCGGSASGYRQIPAMGAAHYGLSATLSLPAGMYYWSVQAVDTAFAGSSWATEGSFAIPTDLSLSKSVTPTVVMPGQTITYTLHFSNTGTYTATGVVISDTVPTEVNVSDISLSIDNLVAYWPLNEGSGATARDITGHGHDGALNNGPVFTTTTPLSITVANPYALQFDGVDDYVVIPDDDAIDFDTNDDFTIALWVKPEPNQNDTDNSDNDIIEKWTGPGPYPYVIRYVNQESATDHGKIKVARYDGAGTNNNPGILSTKTITDNQYHHIAFVKDGSTLSLYIDGTLDGTITDTTTASTANSSPLYIGQRGGNLNSFQGSVDELRIYNRGLAANEIAALIQSSCASGQALACAIGSLAPGQSGTLTITGLISGSLGAPVITNTATITSATAESDLTLANNRDEVGLTVNCPPGTAAHVDRDATAGDNNGTSWGNAFTDLQSALNTTYLAYCGLDEIWVATGVYTPGATVNDTFQLVPGVEIYGGFAGVESERSAREPHANPTVLSGDIAGDDTTDGDSVVTNTTNISGTNSYHVVFADGTTGTPITGSTKMDGFTITAGQANGSWPDSNGGGFFCNGQGSGSECSPNLSHITFSGNRANSHGGAMYNNAGNGGVSSPTLITVTFMSNSANGRGGALYNNGNGGASSPNLTNTTFSGNSAGSGGAIYNDGEYGDSNPILNTAIFTGNSASWSGGAIYNKGEDGNSSPSLTNVTFSNNSVTDSGSGGAIYNKATINGASSPNLTNVTFTGNSAPADGGAIYNTTSSNGTSSPNLTNVTFTGNSATVDGGAISSQSFSGEASPSLTNVSFSGNSADAAGGAMYSGSDGGNSSPNLINVTFSGNSAGTDGGAMYNNGHNGASNPSLSNVILWGNSAAISGTQLYNYDASVVISTSLVEGGIAGTGVYNDNSTVTDGGGNIDADPLFILDVNPSTAPTTTGNLRLGAGSPAIDSGLNSAITVTTDLDGNPRLVDGDLDGTATVDMGAYERQLCFVEANGDNSTDYSSDDASAIQQAVDAAAPGDVLKIAGRCAGVQTRVGLTQTVYISQALTLQGGYTYTNWLASPDLDLYASTLDAQGNGRVVYIPAGITVTISNLILINGSSDVGGGIYSASPLTVTSALIYSNTAGSNGGGLFLDGSSTLISNTHIYNNAAQSDGAGMYISGGTLTLNQSQVYDNHTLGRGNGDRGGAFYAGGATVVLERSAIYANSAGAGGAWVSSGGLITVAHSAIYQNDASYHPGMLQSGGTILTINNSTVSENGHGDEGAIRSWDHADNKVILIHSTIADNQGVGVEIFSGALVMTNTLLANNDNGNCLHAGGSISSRDYNISSDATCPLTATHDLTNTVPLLDTLADNGGESLTHALLHGSPAINHIPYGVNGCGGEFWQDQRGMTRPQLGQCDVGAYEMQPLCLVGTTLFVDQDAGGLQHGGSWADAYTDLQDGLFAAAACTGTEEIWVATGVYTPGATVNHTFQLLDGVAVYGGFAATETQRIQRDWQANPTVLSGDIGGDDTTDTDGVVTDTANITGTNSYHVVTGSGVTATARLDGFSITAGQAYGGSGLDHSGGGMINDGGSPTLAYLRFSGNSASNMGGGMLNVSSSSPTLTNVSFSNNSANWGGGIFNHSSSPTLINASFSDNSANWGGGMYNRTSSPRLTDVSLSNNWASTEGGGMYNNSASSPSLINVNLSGNRADTQGGGMYNSFSNPHLTNVSLSGNWAGAQGGGIYNYGSTPQLYNSILWHNQDNSGLGTITATVVNNNNSTISLTHSLAQGTGGSGSWITDTTILDGGGNLDTDPWFIAPISPTTAPTTTGDLRLLPGSPAIDSGLNSAITATTDLDGNPRFMDKYWGIAAIVDMGAYEHQPTCPTGLVLRVDQNAATPGLGATWDTAFHKLQNALFAASSCSGIEQVWVATGVYTPGATVNDTFQLLAGMEIYGGFAATETQRSERDWQANPTVLSGDIDGNDTTDTNGVVTDTANITGTNSYHVVTGNDADTNSVLDGFHITAGDATNGLWSSNYPDEPTSGGGMYNYDGSATLTQLIFSGNLGDGGGGMYNTGGASQFITVTFINNSSTGSGGGLATYDNNPILQNVVFSGNAATADGGGLFSDGSPTLTNVIFSRNIAGSSGGGIMNDGSGLSLINVSLSGNRANSGGGIYNNYSNSSVYNSILWNNQDSSGTGTITATIYNNNSAITLTHSLVQGSGGSGSWIADTNYVDGGGNLDTDPWFVTPVSPTTAPTTTGNLRLQSVSPAIDVGDNQYITTTTDLDGNPRVADGDWSNTATVDMGAYEYQQPCPTGPAVRVDQNAPTPGLGETWASAALNPQNGLAIAAGCSGITEIWVATGVYTPGANVTDTFQLLDDVALYGGFAGVESERNARDPHANPTVLSGDIAGDDTTNANGVVTATANISGTNSYHVVTGSGVTVTARLDGFSITAGQANGGWVNPCGPACGGGMYNESGSPTLANLSFSGNWAGDEGGGIYNRDNSSPGLTKVSFSGNTANNGGGGMYNYNNSSPGLMDVSFSDNSANNGGGMYNYNASPIVIQAHIFGNSATNSGGGMYNYNNSNPSLVNVSFSGNSAANGGGMCNFLSSSPSLTNISFSGNSADDGGGMYNYGSNPNLTNISFSGNLADYGGGMYNRSNSAPQVYNSVLWNNQDSSGVGTITATIYNDRSAITLTHSLVQGSGGSANWTTKPSFVDGGNNIDADPLFATPISPTTAPTTTGDLHLLPGSPAIDSGLNSAITATTALDGNVRIQDGDADGTATVDMGAYEAPTHYRLTVAKAGNGAGQVSGQPAGIDCGLTCTLVLEQHSAITLSAAADSGSTFTEWSGAGCSGTGDCVVTMDAATQVTATFTLNTYTLDVSKDGDGGGTVSSTPSGIDCGVTCTQDYDYGTVVTLTAAADPGSTFTSWSGTGCSGAGDCVVTMDAAKQVTATFTLVPIGSHALTVLKDGDGGGIVSSTPAGINCGTDCSEIFIESTTVTLTAMASGNSTFDSWSGAGCSGAGDCVVTMDAAKQVTATFTLNTYTLDVSKDGSGSGTVSSTPSGIDCGVSCTQDYVHGTLVTLTVVADSGSTFTSWSGAGCSGAGDCVVTMDAAKQVTATFTLIPAGSHALTVLKDGDGGGIVSSTPAGINCGTDCSEIFIEGTTVTLTAMASGNATFGGWSGAGCGGTADCVVTMDAAKQVTATFTLNTYTTLDVLKDGDGGGTVSSTRPGIDCGADCTQDYIHGTVVTLTVVADSDSTFSGWSGAGCGGLDDCVVTMDASKTVTAAFDLLPVVPTTYTLTLATDGTGSGSVTPDPVGTLLLSGWLYEQGAVVTLTAVPALGSYFGGWTGDLLTADSIENLVMDGNKQVTATFSTEPPVTYTLTVQTVGNGSVSPAGGTYISGTAVILMATPDTGWQFEGWSGDVVSTNNPLNVTMTRDVSVTATFNQSGGYDYIYLPLLLRNG